MSTIIRYLERPAIQLFTVLGLIIVGLLLGNGTFVKCGLLFPLIFAGCYIGVLFQRVAKERSQDWSVKDWLIFLMVSSVIFVLIWSLIVWLWYSLPLG